MCVCVLTLAQRQPLAAPKQGALHAHAPHPRMHNPHP